MSDQQQYPNQQPPQGPQYQQGPPQGWQPPSVKKKHTLRNILLVLSGVFILIVGGCVAFAGKAVNEIDKQSKQEHTVVYKVTGTSKAGSLTYNTDGSTTLQQETSAKLPWSKTLTVKGSLFQIYQLSVQNGLGQKGTVTCTIEVDGKVVKTATGTGEAAIASCDHSN